jgi:hypothetical protein
LKIALISEVVNEIKKRRKVTCGADLDALVILDDLND